MIDRRLPRALRALAYGNADPATGAEAALNAAVADVHALIAAAAAAGEQEPHLTGPQLVEIAG